jgi:hypothetical protein
MNRDRSVSTCFRSVPISGGVKMLPLLVVLACAPVLFAGSLPYDSTPNWVSSDTEVSTGAALTDLNRDGWPDLVVANGNDISRQRLVVYYNQQDGTFPDNPDWQSDDIDYHGHLAVGDVNGDGWPDVAVSVYIGAAGFSEDGKVKLYVNNGSGVLETTPSWSAAEDVYTFRCAFGDMDNDGDLDLAVACGESYNNRPRYNRVFRNSGGMLETTPAWLSDELDSSYDVSWADVDRDGDLDLAFCNSGDPNRVYYNDGGMLATTAGWSSGDTAEQDANTLAWGDVTGDGWLDLAVADNNQLGGSGRFKLYLNNGSGALGSTPGWTSSEGGYGSSVAFSDVDNDGDLDLFCGQWWGPVRVHENQGGALSSSAVWASTTGSVVERISFGDTDRDQLQQRTANIVTTPGRTLYYLPTRPIEQILSVILTTSPVNYCADLENGWVSLESDPMGGTLAISYEYSIDQEMAVSNWDSTVGNYLFVNNGSSDHAGLILTGPGPGPENPPEVRGFVPGNQNPVVIFKAYGVDKFGVNVAAGRIDGEPGDEIITGPGPGAVFGPQVRAFTTTGAAVAGASFLAYGTNKYGVNVAAGDLDGDGRDEFVTGAGPGAAFGPHVRAFSFDNGTVSPVSGVSYFAYGTPKWGVNISCGDIDGDGFDEIVTGAGPGAVYGPHVRGWDVDGGDAVSIPAVSFLAYGTDKYGVNLACGDLDGDGIDEIISGAGPGVVFGPHVRGWNVDGGSVSPMPGISFFAYDITEYGVEVGAGDLDGDLVDEILTGQGPGPGFTAQVRGWDYDGTAISAMGEVDFFAYPASEVRYGAKVTFLEQ